MNEKTLRVLEYHKIKDKLILETVSEMAKEHIKDLMPLSDLQEIKSLLAETSEAVSLLIKKGNIPLNQIYNTKNAIIMSEKGGTLTPTQLLEILYNMKTTKNVKNFFKDDITSEGVLASLTSSLITHRNIEDEIGRCILSESEISDNASVELKNIRRNIVKQNEALRSKLNSIISSSSNKAMLQDAIITLRQGRYVIPVKQEYRSRFQGIVHDQSSTGATLFIEPVSIVNMNNELRELQIKEEAEIEKILAELSLLVAEKASELLSNLEILIKLDYIFAKGKLSVKMKGIEPKLNDDGNMRIRKGRHPLLDVSKVVPIDIHIGKDFNTLVITGPNTGGKTVTLKTVGLFILMTQSGLHIPAEFGTEISIFKKIFADIGDEQSIEQSLSTFSSHMKNIVEILENADYNSAVFLDELGAGTDPTEGAALAISILEYLNNIGAKTIATTHYTELKKYALVNEGVENASVEFDIETLSPTYRLIIGTPGRSNAFEISKKLGLNDEIIQEARKLLGNEDIAFEDIISTIEKDKRDAENERDEAVRLKIEIKKLKDELDRKSLKLEEQREKILQDAKNEARKILKETKAYADNIINELHKLETITDDKERNRSIEGLRKNIKNKFSEVSQSSEENENLTEAPKNLKIGDSVKIITLNQSANVLTLPDKNGELTVQAGLMKINVNIKNLRKINENNKSVKGSRSSVANIYRSKTALISPQIDVRGQLLDDAIMDVDKYLDDAYIAGLHQVTIIHGKGEGILREGLHSMLKSHKHVESYRIGNYNEGGDGATIVNIRG
ncbi:MAG: endonuclease MutS2 [Clostridiales bacterium]|nr:endonuclease MutS2 [Clostridiales bacterium]